MIKVEFTYHWIPILKEEGQEYHFPEEISSFMRKNYRKPAIYRWNVFRNIPSDKKIIYIGEAQELCPQRINGYLYPGPSQRTNNRIKKYLRHTWIKDLELASKFFILAILRLEILLSAITI